MRYKYLVTLGTRLQPVLSISDINTMSVGTLMQVTLVVESSDIFSQAHLSLDSAGDLRGWGWGAGGGPGPGLWRPRPRVSRAELHTAPGHGDGGDLRASVPDQLRD